MVRDPFEDDDQPPLADVLEALSDPDCRTIVESIDEPMTAGELSDRCDIPQSTTYRKLDLLSEASLLEEKTEIRTDGRHTTRYELAFEDINVAVGDDQSLELEITRPARTADERLADMWSEVQKEI